MKSINHLHNKSLFCVDGQKRQQWLEEDNKKKVVKILNITFSGKK